MESNSQDRSLPATERKLQKAIDDGQVTRSRDLGHLAVLGVGAMMMVALAPTLFERLQLHMVRQMSFDATTMRSPGAMLDRLQDMAVWGTIAAGTFASVIIVAVMLSNIAVGGWVNSSKPLVPDISRINPLKVSGACLPRTSSPMSARSW